MLRSCGRAAQKPYRERRCAAASRLAFFKGKTRSNTQPRTEKAKKGGGILPPSLFDRAAEGPAALRRACGKMSQACTASYSRCSESISSLTEMISFTRETLAPQKAKPRSRLPFMALMRAEAMQ